MKRSSEASAPTMLSRRLKAYMVRPAERSESSRRESPISTPSKRHLSLGIRRLKTSTTTSKSSCLILAIERNFWLLLNWNWNPGGSEPTKTSGNHSERYGVAMRLQLTAEGRRLRNKLVKVGFWTTGAMIVLRGCVSVFHAASWDRPSAPVTPVVSQSVGSWSPPQLISAPAEPISPRPQPVMESAPPRPVWTAMPSPRPYVPPLVGLCLAHYEITQDGPAVTWRATASGGTSDYGYSWTGSDGLTGSSDSVTMVYHTGGTKWATVTISSGSQTSRAFRSIYVQNPRTSAERPSPTPYMESAAHASTSDIRTGPTNDSPITWATRRLVATTGWEPSFRAAQRSAWQVLRERVLALPAARGGTLDDVVMRDSALAERVNHAILTYTRVTSVYHGSGGYVRVTMILELREISQVVQAEN